MSSAEDIIAENPAAEGAAGLAAAEAGAGMGGEVDPLDDVRDIFTTLGKKITQSYGMINTHNITGMDNFDCIRVDDAKSFVKASHEQWPKKLACPHSTNCRVFYTGTMTIKRGG